MALTASLPTKSQELDTLLKEIGTRSQSGGQSTDSRFGSNSDRTNAPVATIQNEQVTFRDLTPLELEFSNRAGFLLRQFGHKQLSRLVINQNSNFGGMPENYVLNFGDEIQLVYRGQTNDSYTITVDPSGMLVIPRLTPIRAAGISFRKVRDQITKQVKAGLFETQVEVLMGRVATMPVMVTGEVTRPGRHFVNALSQSIDILAASGGPTPNGSLRRIQLRRQGSATKYIDIYPLLTGVGDTIDANLRPGDRIVVPAVGPSVAVAGHVGRSGIFEMPDGGVLTIGDALRLAGGMTQANASQITVMRIDASGVDAVVPAPRIDDLLQAGDIVLVKRQVSESLNALILSGHVTNPGPVSLAFGADLATVVEQIKFGKKPYLPYAILETKSKDSQSEQFTGVDLARVVAGTFNMKVEGGSRLWILSEDDIAFLNSDILARTIAGQPLPDFVGANDSKKAADLTTVDPLLAAALYDNSPEARQKVLERRLSGELFGGRGARMQDGAFSSRIPQAAPRCNSLTHVAELVRTTNGTRFQAIAGMVSRKKFSNRSPATSDNIRDLINSGQIQIGDNENLQAIMSGQNGGNNKKAMAQPDCPMLFDQNPWILAMALDNSSMVMGAVTRPGLYPVAGGTALVTLMDIAGGATPEGQSGTVEIASFLSDRADSRIKRQSLANLASLGRTQVKPGDTIRLYKGQPNRHVGTITLTGQFVEPGVYSIGPGETLLQLIDRAGGLTEHAFPYGAVFMRESVRKREQEGYDRAAEYLQSAIIAGLARASSSSRIASAAPAMQNLITQIRTTKAVGRIVMEADPAVLQVKPELDLILEAGDHLHMPSRPNSIAVNGQVLSPTSLLFRSGQDIDDYIDQAGGFTRDADKGKAFAILPNGSARRLNLSAWNYETVYLPPGSTIVVPRDLVPFDVFDFSSRLTQIISQVALSAAALNSLNN